MQWVWVAAKLWTDVIANMAEILKLTKSSDLTLGLGARHYIKHPHVSNWQPLQALSAPHTVSLQEHATLAKRFKESWLCEHPSADLCICNQKQYVLTAPLSVWLKLVLCVLLDPCAGLTHCLGP